MLLFCAPDKLFVQIFRDGLKTNSPFPDSRIFVNGQLLFMQLVHVSGMIEVNYISKSYSPNKMHSGYRSRTLRLWCKFNPILTAYFNCSHLLCG